MVNDLGKRIIDKLKDGKIQIKKRSDTIRINSRKYLKTHMKKN